MPSGETGLALADKGVASMARRFRGFLPVVVDLETSGFDSERHGVLEIAALTLRFDEGALVIDARHRWPVRPFAEAEINPDSLRLTGIDLNDPQRGAISEAEAIKRFFKLVRNQIKAQGCHRGVLVAHNAVFDAAFLRSAAKRANAKRDPFHPFTTIDTAALAAVAYGHTVLREACARAGIGYSKEQAHSALYDAERCALLFCKMVNDWGEAMGDKAPWLQGKPAQQGGKAIG